MGENLELTTRIRELLIDSLSTPSFLSKPGETEHTTAEFFVPDNHIRQVPTCNSITEIFLSANYSIKAEIPDTDHIEICVLTSSKTNNNVPKSRYLILAKLSVLDKAGQTITLPNIYHHGQPLSAVAEIRMEWFTQPNGEGWAGGEKMKDMNSWKAVMAF